MGPVYSLLGMHCRGERMMLSSENYEELHEKFKEKQMQKKRSMEERLQSKEIELLEKRKTRMNTSSSKPGKNIVTGDSKFPRKILTAE